MSKMVSKATTREKDTSSDHDSLENRNETQGYEPITGNQQLMAAIN